MTLGDVKAEALRLMFVEANPTGDTVAEFENDPSFGVLYANMTGAINRAFADIETREILPCKRVTLAVAKTSENVVYLTLAGVTDLYAPCRLSCLLDGFLYDNVPFELEAGVIRVADPVPDGKYDLLYYPLLERVSDTTPNSTELLLPISLAEALPYYVKADVYRVDEPGEANDARNWYEAAVAAYADRTTSRLQRAVETVFGGF